MNFGAVIGVLLTLLTGLVGIGALLFSSTVLGQIFGALMLIIAMLGMILTALFSGMMDIRRALAQGSMERRRYGRRPGGWAGFNHGCMP